MTVKMTTPQLINTIKSAIANKTSVLSVVKIFEDDDCYWLIHADGEWVTLDKANSQVWLIEELVNDYISVLFAVNNISYEDCLAKEYTISEDGKEVTIKIGE